VFRNWISNGRRGGKSTKRVYAQSVRSGCRQFSCKTPLINFQVMGEAYFVEKIIRFRIGFKMSKIRANNAGTGCDKPLLQSFNPEIQISKKFWESTSTNGFPESWFIMNQWLIMLLCEIMISTYKAGDFEISFVSSFRSQVSFALKFQALKFCWTWKTLPKAWNFDKGLMYFM